MLLSAIGREHRQVGYAIVCGCPVGRVATCDENLLIIQGYARVKLEQTQLAGGRANEFCNRKGALIRET
jgi:hypothetical protein